MIKKVFTSFIFMALSLTSCGLSTPSININKTSSNEIKGNESYVIKEGGNINSKGLSGREFFDYREYIMNTKSLPSTGKQNILVIPVCFSDSCFSSGDMVTKIVYDLDETFNYHDNDDSNYTSVSEFYYRSSYGNLDLEFNIIKNWTPLGLTVDEFLNLDGEPTVYAVNKAVDYLTLARYDLTKFDSDKDGYIDGIWLIYSEPSYPNSYRHDDKYQNTMWAYTYWAYNNKPNVDAPKANAYCWGSYDFMYDFKSKLELDSHTYIHETGHLLGLDDYYDYDDLSNPCGSLDMMDYNIGDHNPYSKYLLGWCEPQIVNDFKKTYVLDKFQENGDFLIIPSRNEVNSSPLDEYFIIEYYTPDGLNYFDSVNNYLNRYPKMYTKPGIRFFHVDSRLGELNYNNKEWSLTNYIGNYSFEDLCDETYSTKYFDIANSNTESYSYMKNRKLLSLISNNTGSYYQAKSPALDSDLFNNGSYLKPNTLKFNSNKNAFEYMINFEIKDNKAYISFE